MSYFDKLAPFIQNWIYREQWNNLREVQIEAIKIILETESHLLLATATASGKTEAAFFPALTKLFQNPSATIGILYISPLKALINDQHKRLTDLLDETSIKCFRWHGDISSDLKKRLIKNPSGILQITPESLESMLINRNQEIRNLFGDLKFIIIDEVHVFMNDQRGMQVLAQLERIAEIIGYNPRRVGLSATLGDYQLAEKWLSSGTDNNAVTPEIIFANKKVRLAVEHFLHQNPIPSALNPELDREQIRKKESPILPSFEYLYKQTFGKKCLIFSNTREEAETAITGLRRIAELKQTPDYYFIHHGSISSTLRESAEKEMKSGDFPTVTAATVTLELGIDIGDMERIIQFNCPRTVTSFLQRLGRSGRRSNSSEILFVHTEEEPSDNKPLPYIIPWELLQSVAIIELYLKERWIESYKPLQKPFSLLYHQTMSILGSLGELSPRSLAKRVLDLSIFKNITQEEFKELITHLIETNHIESLEGGGLCVGLEGERILRNFRFYAVFQDQVEYTVKEKDSSKEIGKLGGIMLPGERFPLAGWIWEVIEAFPKQRMMIVNKVRGNIKYQWPGDVAPISKKVNQKIRDVLTSQEPSLELYPYLQKGALERLKQAYNLATKMDMGNQIFYKLSEGKFVFFPWISTKGYRTLERILKGNSSITIRRIYGWSPYYLFFEIENDNEVDNLKREFYEIIRNLPDLVEVVGVEEEFYFNKFDQYLPVTLQKSQFLNDLLDLPEVKDSIEDW